MKKVIISSFAGFLSFSVSCQAISTNFLSRGFKSCAGYCEVGKINCQKGVDKQGYYDWCKKNCTQDSKSNLQAFLDGIKSCDAKNINSLPSPKSLTPEERKAQQEKAQALERKIQQYQINNPSASHGGKSHGGK